MITDTTMVEVYAAAIRAQKETPSGRVEVHISQDVQDAIREQFAVRKDVAAWSAPTIWGFPLVTVPGVERLEVHAITRIEVTL